MKVRVLDGKVRTWLNGQQMIFLDDEKIAGAEAFALQIHDGGRNKSPLKEIKNS